MRHLDPRSVAICPVTKEYVHHRGLFQSKRYLLCGFNKLQRTSMCLSRGSDFRTAGVYAHMSCRYGVAPLLLRSALRCECVGFSPSVEEISSISGISPEMRSVAEYEKYVSSSRSDPLMKPRRVLSGFSIEH